MIRGAVRATSTSTPISDGQTVTAPIALPDGGRLVRARAYVSGSTTQLGNQSIVGVLKDSGGALLATTPAVIVADSTPGTWVTLDFDAVGWPLMPGTYQVGIVGGPTGGVARLHDATIGGVAVNLEVIDATTIPAATTSIEIAQLSHVVSQRLLGDGRDADRVVRGAAGWYGRRTGLEQGAVAVVRTGGPMQDLVGQRVRVTNRASGASVAVYVYDEEDGEPDEDISIPLRAWIDVAAASADTVEVDVRVIS